jgi:ABC-type nickel/cobalt efflux system permease component RcnA
MKKDLYFVLTAGLIPCPGTVILFIYAFMLKTYFAVILASIFISLGMGLVIFASSFLGVSVQKVSEKSHKLTNFLEYLSPVVMFLLGVLLFLNAQMV